MTDKKKETPQPDAPPASESPEPVDLDALKSKAAQRDEFLDLAQRARAELINYRNRVERERGEWADRAVAEFATKILPVLDDFDRALREAESVTDVAKLLDGFRQIDRKLHIVFKSAGLEAFAPHGKTFDPAEHEAVVIEETDEHPHHAVGEVMRKGWKLRGKVLRPAQVKVTMKPEEKKDDKEPTDESRK
jgi:molecular chaperone GrpE